MASPRVWPLLLLIMSVAVQVQGAEAPSALEAGKVKALFERLSDENFLVRQEATAQLMKMGQPVLPLLDQLEKETRDLDELTRCVSIRNVIEGPVAKPIAFVAAPDAAHPGGVGPTLEIQPFDRTEVIRADSRLLILDGRGSTGAPRERMRYVWTQTDGEHLMLLAEMRRKPRIELPVHEAGVYRFELLVSDGKRKSAPVEVVVRVDNPGASKSEVRE